MKSKRSGSGGSASKRKRAPERRRVGAEHRLEEALEATARALGELEAPWMLIGGLAMIARGVRRATTDIDVVVRGDAVEVRQVLSILAAHGLTPRHPDAEAFARDNLVLLLRHRPTGVDLDLSFAWSAFEHEALAASRPGKLGRVRLPIAQPDDLIVFKIVAGRAKDLSDVSALLTSHAELDVPRIRRHVRALAELADAPEMVMSFENALALARSVRTRPRS